MVETQNQKKQLDRSNSVTQCIVSCTMVLLTQFALSLVPRFLSSSPILIQLSLSVVVLLAILGSSKWLRRSVGVNGSASAFVFLSILFTWCFYVLIIRQAISVEMDLMFNGLVIILIAGLYRMLKSDPGLVKCEDSSLDKHIVGLVSEFGARDNELEISSSESDVLLPVILRISVLGKRVRYCKVCKAYVKGFDHHCPAFGNCIGEGNYLHFMVLLFGFLVIEASYLACSYKYIAKLGISKTRINSEISLSESLAYSTVMFSILQLVWQVVFFAWHVYCICFNIRTDEWINWKKYSEFHSIVQSQQGQCCTTLKFTNPYDKGVLDNVKEFLLSKH